MRRFARSVELLRPADEFVGTVIVFSRLHRLAL
jgi:hypothetical protein